MTWKSFHSRGETLRSVIAAADVRRDGILPLDVEGVHETFADELSLLGALQLRWHTRLAGRIERELMGQPMDLESAVLAAWRATAAEMPGVLAVLDHYRSEPLDAAMADAMAKATATEHTLLAVMAGQSSTSDRAAAAVGATLESKARASMIRLPQSHRAEAAPHGLLDRLKAAIAA